MTDKSDQQDGDGLTPTRFVDDLLSACDPSNWDAERHQGNYFAGLKDAYDNIHGIANEYQTAMYWWTKSAPPKPVPDAMRNCPRCGSSAPRMHPAVQHEGEVELCTHEFHLCPTNQNTPKYIAAVEAKRALSEPVPPADGVRIARLEQTIQDSIEALERNSTSAPVVECLKAALSPSPAVATEPVADERVKQLAARLIGYVQARPDYSYDRLLEHISETLVTFAYNEILNHRKGMDASPPVREDREAIARALAITMHGDDVEWRGFLTKADTFITFLPVQPVAPRLPQDTLDRLANAGASAEEIKDALVKAYAFYRWKAKLEDLPDDMKDDCYGFAGSIQSGENSDR